MNDIDDMLKDIASSVFSQENQEPDINTNKLFPDAKLFDDFDDENNAPAI